MKVHTYLNFNGNCAEAFRYYEQHLGGTPGMMMKHGDNPDPRRLGPEMKDQVLHAQMTIANAELMGADVPNAEPTRSAYLSISADSDADAERMFHALSDGGEVFMPMQETFFATRFGMCRDRFGVGWMLLRERPQPQG